MTVMDEYENVDAVFGEPQASEGQVYIPLLDVRRVSGTALTILDRGKQCKEGGEVETAVTTKAEEPVYIQKRLLAHIEVGDQGVQIRPTVDRKRILLGAVLLASWSVGWISAALLSIFKRKV